MNSTLSIGFQLRQGVLARALSLLLLAFVFYGTTVEAAHRHGPVLAFNSISAFTSPDPDNNQGSSLVGCSDCLICQLHQGFSATVVTTKTADAPQLHRTSFTATATAVFSSHYCTPQRGRAPPLITS